ncbi:MAG: YidC/Oxa1 family insertase periplasmic-domain containing protein [Kiritimatiellia bacterium]
MNRQEKIIAALMGLALVVYMMYSGRMNAERSEGGRPDGQSYAAASNQTAVVEEAAPVVKSPLKKPAAAAEPAVTEVPDEPEKVVKVETDELLLELSSHGAVIKSVLLKKYNSEPGEAGPDNPPVILDFSDNPGFELQGIPGLPANAAYEIKRCDDECSVEFQSVTEQGLTVTRKLQLLDNYQVKVSDSYFNRGEAALALRTNSVCMGSMYRGQSKNDIVSIDALPDKEDADVMHWDKNKQTRGFIGASGGFGCGGAKSAVGMPDRISVPMDGAHRWVAVKSRFFVTAFSSDTATCGYEAVMERDLSQEKYVLSSLGAKVCFPGRLLDSGESFTRDYTLYVGPKKIDLLNEMGSNMDAIMQFGKFSWFCKLLVPTLNFFYRLIPNYGVAIILLTVLVRIIFWPLTHRSTKSMRKMQEIQPQLKALQAKFKDNPQKLQQETWAVYKENKVNPLSSCLPMLIQIPVFIALFTVLRSAVELRYASFLWIRDLSQPENLFADTLPIALNILPIMMSGTMALQSYLTPSTGDPQQQKMMMIMMPVMMLFMFYSFPSALSLYWTVSQVLAIVQMLLIRRHHPPEKDDGIEDAEVVQTRQQRRQMARG